MCMANFMYCRKSKHTLEFNKFFFWELEVLKDRCLPHIPFLGYSGDDSGCIVFSEPLFSICPVSQRPRWWSSLASLPPNVYPLVNSFFLPSIIHPPIHQLTNCQTCNYWVSTSTVQLLHIMYSGALLCVCTNRVAFQSTYCHDKPWSLT